MDGSFIDEEGEVENELTREGSWLASDGSFQWIKALAMEDKIAAITIDIRDTDRFQKIAKIYRDNSIAVDSLYLSNICHYMGEKDKAAFASTVHALMQAETIVINCARKERRRGFDVLGTASLIQGVYLGKTFEAPEDDQRLFSGQ
jgi:hypothetical protein